MPTLDRPTEDLRPPAHGRLSESELLTQDTTG